MDKVPSKGGKPTQSIDFTLLSLKGFKAHLSALSALEEVESSTHSSISWSPSKLYFLLET